ncbi:homeobox and C2H2 transcription factor [Purpureocillium lavendulum]|uniref:Homeobox and C2H2 transcription factor n=1 Tax=Purpureocillium lavendulum TaxID=1247861 RepID=A0AB34G1H3_9HYPO|nr:homeobox and C2H2 transcription factor [Purpureocillium lavendulum]
MSLHDAFFLGDIGSSAGPPLGDATADEPRAEPASAPEGATATAGLDHVGLHGAGVADLDWPDTFLFGTDDDAASGTMPAFQPSLSAFDPVDPIDPSLGFQPSDFTSVLPPGPGGVGGRPEHLGMAEFFLKNGAWRPPEPCTHCRRLRLQCFMLQTTAANPNPVHSCSSCVALFRQCSLAERSKRHPSYFETTSPVIGQLHGVNEEDDPSSWTQPVVSAVGTAAETPAMPIATTSSKRSSSRSVRKTQVLREWFSANIGHPYPTDDEKSALADQSGLSRTQVINWFTNARRRHRLSTQPMVNNATFRAGSPMPRSLLSSMTPFERWRHSPPESEPVSESAIQNALDTGVNHTGLGEGTDNFTTTVLGSSASDDSMFFAPSAHPYSSEASVSSTYSHRSGNSDAAHSGRSFEDQSQPPWTNSSNSRARRSKPRTFVCGYCSRAFSKKYDWLRHERSVHAPGDVSWICAVPLPQGQPFVLWRLGGDQPECIFCGHGSPSEEHIQSHEFEACSKRAVQDRSFSRKDHMWQHLYKFHGCRKWEGWKPDLNLLQHKS